MLVGAAAGAVLLGGGVPLVLGLTAGLVLILTVSYIAVVLRPGLAD